jgi:tetratricopeptide (TPR) repeat protein
MAEKRPKRALGRGLGALIKNQEEVVRSRKEAEDEKRSKNMEFYRSLVKQYVQTGERDILTEQLLNDIRSHLKISDKEHLHLIQTLRKREQNKPKISEEGKEEMQKEIKFEMKQLLNDIKKEESGGVKKQKKKKKIRITFEDDIDKKDRIRLPEETVKIVNGDKRSKPIQAGPGDDEGWPESKMKLKRKIKKRVLKKPIGKAGLINGEDKVVQTKVEWDEGLEYGRKPIQVTAPRPELDESKETIQVPAPKPGMEESYEALELEPSKIDDEEEVPMGVIIDEKKDEPVQTLVDEQASAYLPTEDLEEIQEEIPPPPVKPAVLETQVAIEIPEDQETPEEIEEPEELEEPEGIIEEFKGEQEEPEEQEEIIEELEEETEEITEEEEPEEFEEEEIEEVLEDSLMSIKILMDEGKLIKAHDMAQRILTETPENVAVLNECGVILYHLNNLQGAYDCYRKAFELEEPSAETMTNYALILSEMGELDASISILNKSIEKDPYSEDGWNNKAVVLYKAGRLRESLECLDEALRINEKSIETWINTGIILEKMGEYGPAKECYQNILGIDPDNQIAREGIEYCSSRI